MAAAELTEVKRNEMHIMPVIIKAQCPDAGGDWVVLDGFKGVIPISGMAQSILTSASEILTYGVARINGAGQDTTTNTSFILSACTITRTPNYYLLSASGEIMEVLTDSNPASATPTVTVRRGCLGTTPSATGLATTNYLGIMNIVFLGRALAGPHLLVVLPLPNDPFFTNADGGVR